METACYPWATCVRISAPSVETPAMRTRGDGSATETWTRTAQSRWRSLCPASLNRLNISLSLSLCLSMRVCVCLLVCLFVCLFVCVSVCLLSVCLSACLSLCLFVLQLNASFVSMTVFFVQFPSLFFPLPIIPVVRSAHSRCRSWIPRVASLQRTERSTRYTQRCPPSQWPSERCASAIPPAKCWRPARPQRSTFARSWTRPPWPPSGASLSGIPLISSVSGACLEARRYWLVGRHEAVPVDDCVCVCLCVRVCVCACVWCCVHFIFLCMPASVRSWDEILFATRLESSDLD